MTSVTSETLAQNLRKLAQSSHSQAAPKTFFPQLEQFYLQKLWHQLTTLLLSTASGDAWIQPLLIPLYQQFLQHIQKYLNPQSLVQLMLITARQFQDPKQAADFLQTIATQVQEAPKTAANEVQQKAAVTLARLESAHYQLLLKQMDVVKRVLEESESQLDHLQLGVDPVVHALYYRVAADYHKAKAEYNQYYKNALLYLACVHSDQLSKQEKVERAHDLALSALLGDQIYNFGELLMHPIFEELKGTPHEWLMQLLLCFNSGDIGKFDVLSAQFTKQPLLQQNMHFLRQKICLMALIESVFKRMGTQRRIPFNTIGQETRLPAHEIEHLVMKALSLSLIKGHLDQVAEVIEVEWVVPRVLGRQQIGTLAERVAAWRQKVQAAATSMQTEAPELFV